MGQFVMVSVGLRELTKMVKHFFVKHANSGPEGTKGGGGYEKMGRVATMGEGSCDGRCHPGGEEHSHAKLLLPRRNAAQGVRG